MRNPPNSTLYGLLCSVGLFLSACSGSGDDEPVYMVDSDSGNAFDTDEIGSRDENRGVAPSQDAAELLDDTDASVDALVDASGDAAEVVTDATTVTKDAGDASVDASGDAAEVVTDATTVTKDAGDAAELLDADDGAAELDARDGAADCNPIGRWQVYINQSPIQCFNTQGSEGFFIDISSVECEQDLEISLDINALPSIWGHFVGTISYHLDFEGDTLTATAEISGTITNGAGTMQCESTAFVTGIRR